MLSVLLFILKLIGIILIVIIGLVLFIILTVLLVPVRYRVNAEKCKGIKVSADVTWLARLIQIRVDFEDKVLSYYVRIAWKKLINKEAKKGKTEDSEDIFEETDFVEDDICERELEEDRVSDVAIDEDEYPELIEDEDAVSDTDLILEEEISEEEPEEESENEPAEEKKEDIPEDEPEKSTKKSESILDKLLSVWGKATGKTDEIRTKVENIQKKINGIKKKADIYYRFITHKITQAAIRHVKKEIFYLLRHYLPRKVSGELTIGFEDPSQTGKILGYITAVNAMMRQPLAVKVDFENEILEGKLDVKGHIRSVHVIKSGLVLVLDRNIWKTIKRFKKIKKL